MFKYDVFISYSSKDKDVVHALAERLKKDGLRVWLDKWEIGPGSPFSIKIQEGLDNSFRILMCMSSAYFDSDWTTSELHARLSRDPINKQCRLVPLLIADCNPPDIIAQFEYIDWRKKSNEAYKMILKTCYEQNTEILSNLCGFTQADLKNIRHRVVYNYQNNNYQKKVFCKTLYNDSMKALSDYSKNYFDISEYEKNILKCMKVLLDPEFSFDVYIEQLQDLRLEHKLCEICSISEPDELPEPGRVTCTLDIIKGPKFYSFTAHDVNFEFVEICNGKFCMGSPIKKQYAYDNESPIHEITIKNPFLMGKYPVTQLQWEKIMGSNPSHFKGEDLPVDSVSWDDVQKFIKRLNENKKDETQNPHSKYRLPSEAEWEYVCRAGTTARFFFGNNESKLDDYAWYSENSDNKIHPVCKKKPNPWGLFDILGNVWEWVQDCSHDSYNGAPCNGSAWVDGKCTMRILRGGSWDNHANLCRSAVRKGYFSDSKDKSHGFRLVREC